MKITLEVGNKRVSCETDFAPNKSVSPEENYDKMAKLFNEIFCECVRQMDKLTQAPVVHPFNNMRIMKDTTK